MPIYTYRCDHCGIQFERQQHFSDPPLTWCPECNRKSLRKVYTPVGIVFKGSGFYATDHRSPSGGHSSRDKASEARKSGETERTTSTESKEKKD
jgi:putative FmdB family regulatory protein